MDKAIIYVWYDSIEYTNYYSLAVNGKIECDFLPEERNNEIIARCDELGISKTETLWCVVVGEDVMNQSCTEILTSNGYKLKPMPISKTTFIEELNTLFDDQFTMNQDESSGKKAIKIVYPEYNVENTVASNPDEAVGEAAEILTKAGMTELAKIIKEKYERMNKHE